MGSLQAPEIPAKPVVLGLVAVAADRLNFKAHQLQALTMKGGGE